MLTAAKAGEPLVSHPRVLGLGEMMNYPGTINAAAAVLDKSPVRWLAAACATGMLQV